MWFMGTMGIMGLVVAVLGTIIIPPSASYRIKPSWKRLDLGGVSLITGT
jgi:hypothetical protein